MVEYKMLLEVSIGAQLFCVELMLPSGAWFVYQRHVYGSSWETRTHGLRATFGSDCFPTLHAQMREEWRGIAQLR